jgi:RNA-binding protein
MSTPRTPRPRTRARAEGPERTDPRSEGETTAKPKRSSGGRRTRQKARINKKTGDVRSKPEERSGAPRPVTGSGIRYLRGLGHHLDPVVQVGKEGITDALVAALREALTAHELVKVKVLAEAPVDRKEAGPELATRTGATLAQVLGRTVLLYKRHPQKPKIELPR